MPVLIVIGVLAGLVTGLSPCILPVIPVVFAAGTVAGATEEDVAVTRRGLRPSLAVVAGIVLSFSALTLFGSWLLTLLGLPQDVLRDLGIVVLSVVALGLIVPSFGELLARPFARLGGGRQRAEQGGFVLGLSLGLLYVPCAGPVLAAITVVGAGHRIGLGSIVLTLAFAVGVAIPLLCFALAGQHLVGHRSAVRARATITRKVAGGVLLATALVIGLNLTDGLQRRIPGYTRAFQSGIESNAAARRALSDVTGRHTTTGLATCPDGTEDLVDCGPAPALTGITSWLNTPGDKPLTLAGLEGRVVLVDFWTYSCINCQRTLPHLEAWDKAYRGAGLTIIGVHTPEFAFEKVRGNVRSNLAELGVSYPVALDDDYGTWNAYGNQYWPAEYLIDAEGTVRHVEFGEGSYARTEQQIRTLLAEAGPRRPLESAPEVADATPDTPLTPETYLGSDRLVDRSDQLIEPGVAKRYAAPDELPADGVAFQGTWTIGGQAASSGDDATLLLDYRAAKVYLVLGGTGTVGVSVDGRHTTSVHVSGAPTLYRLVDGEVSRRARLTLDFSKGVQAYAFTFG